MKIQLDKLAPSPAEFGLFGFLAVALSLVGNGKELLVHYGLISSAQTLSTSAGSTITQGLAKLDTYQATTSIVTFAVWAVIGLFTLSVVQVLISLSREFTYRQHVSSNAYVHPIGFNRKGFWRQFVLQSLGAFVALLVCVAYVVLFCLYILPIGLLYTQALYLSLSVHNLAYGLLGLGLLFVGLVLLDVLARLVRFRHTLISSH